MLKLTFAAVITVALVNGIIAAEVRKFPDCDSWALEGECINNPNFMWTACHASCMTGESAAKDVEDRCGQWMNEGECTNNPNYIHLHCPVSCGQAVGWSPWARREVGIDMYLPFDDEIAKENCPVPSNMFAAAELIRYRLIAYLSGGAASVIGLSSAAPSEYLGMMGLAEAFLYSLRLYNIAISSSSSPDASSLETTRLHVAEVLHVLSQGYGSDLLMRSLPTWLPLLNQSAELAEEKLKQADPANPREDLPETCPAYSTASIQDFAAEFPRLATDPSAHALGAFVTLHNGVKMPSVGLGTWQLQGAECETAVGDAIDIGYRHIDSAEAYRNEAQVGWAVKHAIERGTVRREDLFLATKISDESHAGYEGVKRMVEEQLKLLQTTYIDLYMLHSPISDRQKQADTWRALEELYDQGVIRALGVSNFDSRELRALVSAARVRPMVVQNKLDPYHIGKQLDNRGDDIVSYTRQEGIVLVAYSPFSAYPFAMKPADDPIIRNIASGLAQATGGKPVTASQVILRWAQQSGFATIPRSSNAQRLRENWEAQQLPKLSDTDMATIGSLQFLVESSVSKGVPI